MASEFRHKQAGLNREQSFGLLYFIVCGTAATSAPAAQEKQLKQHLATIQNADRGRPDICQDGAVPSSGQTCSPGQVSDDTLQIAATPGGSLHGNCACQARAAWRRPLC